MLIICLGLLGRCLLQLTKRRIIFSPVFCSNFQTWKNPPPDSLSVYIHNGGAQCHQCIFEMWEERKSWVWPYVTAASCHSYRGYVASGVSHAMHIMKAIPVVVQRVTVGCSEWFQANLTPQYQEWERRQLSLEGEVMVSLFRRLQIKVKPPLEI